MSYALSTNAGKTTNREIKLTKKRLRKNPVFPCTTYRPDETGEFQIESVVMPKTMKRAVY